MAAPRPDSPRPPLSTPDVDYTANILHGASARLRNRQDDIIRARAGLNRQNDDLEWALRLSREEYRQSAESSLQSTRTPNQHRALSNPYTNIETTILRLNNELPPISVTDADTLVYIGPPPRGSGQSARIYDKVVQHFRYPHLIRSQSLKEMKSAKLDQLIGPKSLRTEKKLRKEGVLSRVYVDGVKFYVDLGPPCEDEEAIVLLTELTCTKGVLNWYKAQRRYSIACTMLCGNDESPLSPAKESTQSSSSTAELPFSTEESAARLAAQGGVSGTDESDAKTSSEEQGVEDADDEPEYSPLRHRSALERLVRAIEHQDPKLDSAPKVWTYFAVAKFFDCAANERVSGWIYQWLSNDRNNNFIQNNPEVSYRMGLGIKSCGLTRDTFSILVGEKALEIVRRETDPTLPAIPTSSVHGRTMELLDDDEQNRIEHAAAGLARRMRDMFERFIGADMAWLDQDNREYQRILHIVPESPEQNETIEELILSIKEYVRGRIYWILCRNYRSDHGLGALDTCLAKAASFNAGLPASFFEVFNRLNGKERIFTRFFWLVLAQDLFEDGEENTGLGGIDFPGEPECGWTDLALEVFGVYSRTVSRQELETKMHAVNAIRKHQLRPAFDSNMEQLQALRISSPDFDDSHPMSEFSYPDGQGDMCIEVILRSITLFVRHFALTIAEPAHLTHGRDRVPTTLINTLMCLEYEEWKYLPLWADGNDDGTGGVYIDDDVPNLEGGVFRGGKRGMDFVQGGSNAASCMSSDFEDVANEMVSTVGRASKDATDGTETVKTFSMTGSDAGALNQKELWEQVMEFKVDYKGKRKAEMVEDDECPEPYTREGFKSAGKAVKVEEDDDNTDVLTIRAASSADVDEKLAIALAKEEEFEFIDFA